MQMTKAPLHAFLKEQNAHAIAREHANNHFAHAFARVFCLMLENDLRTQKVGQ